MKEAQKEAQDKMKEAQENLKELSKQTQEKMKEVGSKLSSKFKSFFDKGEESPSKDQNDDQEDKDRPLGFDHTGLANSSLAFNAYNY